MDNETDDKQLTRDEAAEQMFEALRRLGSYLQYRTRSSKACDSEFVADMLDEFLDADLQAREDVEVALVLLSKVLAE